MKLYLVIEIQKLNNGKFIEYGTKLVYSECKALNLKKMWKSDNKFLNVEDQKIFIKQID